MRDSLSIGPSPAAENCAQLGSDDYNRKARIECRAFISQLRRMYGEEPVGARLYIKSNPHDFGSYYEVECQFDSDNEKAVEYAFNCENIPEEWDAKARKEIAAELGPVGV